MKEEKTVQTFSTCSGGVMFVPERIERRSNRVSYRTLAAQEPAAKAPAFSLTALIRRAKASLLQAA
ncbi:MAG: hypothetical protein L6Q57_05050 [Alphaproteobacteria bacterium]|nr:hypothetical protein [Alphaproteobacteria bacterium]